jgi:hypothetical protein
MAKKVIIVGAKPKRIEVVDQPKRRIEPEELAAALGANSCSQEASRNLDPLSLAELGTQLLHRLRSSGGRPALTDATVNCRVPLSSEDVQMLEEMLSHISESTGTKPSVGQLASIIVRQYLIAVKNTSEGHDSHVAAEIVRQFQPHSSALATNPPSQV